MGYTNDTNGRSLAFMDQTADLKTALKINMVMVRILVDEAQGLHPRFHEEPAVFQTAPRSPPQKKPFATFVGKLEGSNTCTATELKRFLGSLACYTYGQDDFLGSIMCQSSGI